MKKTYYLFIFILTTLGCDQDSNDGLNPTQGQGGSLATFALKGDYLYTVDRFNLNIFSLNDSEKPVVVNQINVGFDIETLFGYKDYLYIGSTTGMFIYNLSNPEFPEKLSNVQHFTACDPVVANDKYAYVTLHSDTFCGNNINLLEIYDVTDVTAPILVSSRNMIFPKGLGLYGDYLVVCDDEIKIFDVSNPEESVLVNAIDKKAFDVIITQDLLIAIGETGLFQYQLSTTTEGVNYEELSAISI